MADPRQQRLDEAIRRRDAAQRTVQQLQGRLAAAQDEVRAIEQECRDRGVAPDKLDAAISQLESRHDTAVTAFETEIQTVEGQIALYTEDHQ